MQDVGAQHLVFAGQGVDDHFGTGRTEREVVERPATGLAAVVIDFRGLVEAGARQRYLGKVSLLDQRVEADDLVADTHMIVAELDVFLGHLVLPRSELDQALLDGLCRVLCCLAVQVGAGRGRRR
ncbi:hypothetical protein D3C76_1382670 [compost metagenome]